SKQPRVLHGDYRLISEDGDKFDLLIGKWAYLVAAKRKGANRLPVAQKRHSKDRPVPEPLLIVHRVGFWMAQHVGYLTCFALPCAPPGRAAAARPLRL